MGFHFELCEYGLREVRREWERRDPDGGQFRKFSSTDHFLRIARRELLDGEPLDEELLEELLLEDELLEEELDDELELLDEEELELLDDELELLLDDDELLELEEDELEEDDELDDDELESPGNVAHVMECMAATTAVTVAGSIPAGIRTTAPVGN